MTSHLPVTGSLGAELQAVELMDRIPQRGSCPLVLLTRDLDQPADVLPTTTTKTKALGGML